jgi:cytochrome c-type biogenesis protein
MYSFLEVISRQLYHLQQLADTLVTQQLSHLGLLSVGIIFTAGLLTSLTPCMLSMLPLTIGYIAGYESTDTSYRSRQSLWFALGLATTLALLGVIAASLGRIYGQIGTGLPILVSLVAIIMGLNLLEVLPLRLPNFPSLHNLGSSLPPAGRSYLFGFSFGLIASPCSTPVLATLLAWVANSQDLALGSLFLLSYALGYVLPVVIAGLFTASLKKLLELRQWSGWINPLSGILFLVFGVFSLLSRLPLANFSPYPL